MKSARSKLKLICPNCSGKLEHGRSFVIRRRGKAVARLIPPDCNKSVREWSQVIRSFRDLRERIAKKTGQINIRELIEEGRRF